MKIPVYNLEGKEIEKMEVSDDVFGLAKNDDLVHQAMVSILANERQSIAHTKTRGERAGSGKKPWKQKGTGRARVGSVRTPVWKKGGVAFGPRSDRNFKKKINKKMNIKAILTVFSEKMRDKEIYAVDKLEFSEKKTKEAAKALVNLKIKGKVLIALNDQEKDLKRISRNIKNVKNVPVAQLNVLDLLSSKNLLMSKESVKFLEKKYGSK